MRKAVEYRDVPGFHGYSVGSNGSVWSRWRLGSNSGLLAAWLRRRLRPSIGSDGYSVVTLHKAGRQFTKRVHCLVLEAFVGPCPVGMEACHDPDPTRTNCRLDNLRWDTRQNNRADSARLREAGVIVRPQRKALRGAIGRPRRKS